jgi:hypothetical protein
MVSPGDLDHDRRTAPGRGPSRGAARPEAPAAAGRIDVSTVARRGRWRLQASNWSCTLSSSGRTWERLFNCTVLVTAAMLNIGMAA